MMHRVWSTRKNGVDEPRSARAEFLRTVTGTGAEARDLYRLALLHGVRGGLAAGAFCSWCRARPFVLVLSLTYALGRRRASRTAGALFGIEDRRAGDRDRGADPDRQRALKTSVLLGIRGGGAGRRHLFLGTSVPVIVIATPHYRLYGGAIVVGARRD